MLVLTEAGDLPATRSVDAPKMHGSPHGWLFEATAIALPRHQGPS